MNFYLHPSRLKMAVNSNYQITGVAGFIQKR